MREYSIRAFRNKIKEMIKRKNDNSNIPGLIDRMNKDQKRVIIEDWIRGWEKRKAKTKIEKN